VLNEQKRRWKMDSPILSLDSVSKKFCRDLKRSLWYGVKDLAGEMILTRDGRGRLRQDEFWALKDVSVEVRRGETLGLIGANGAGKSTLLKLINGLIKPDGGRITVRGQVGALIELGTGFNPVLTGRENIYVNAAILGLSRKEVDRRLEEIIDFAEIGDFIDAPVQSYSSGMKVRLGFAVVAHLEPDLLLIDEILSVGDTSFRQRCVNRLTDFKRNGGTIIFVSHNSSVVEAISDRVMLLDHGEVAEIGQPAEVVRNYEGRALQRSREADLRLRGETSDLETDDIGVVGAEFRDLRGNEKQTFEFGESFQISIRFESRCELRYPYFTLAIQKGARSTQYLSALSMFWDGIDLETVPRQGVIGCVIKSPSFSPGHYRLYLCVLSEVPSTLLGKKKYMEWREVGFFTVVPGPLQDRLPRAPAAMLLSEMAPMVLDHTWNLNGDDLDHGAKRRGP